LSRQALCQLVDLRFGPTAGDHKPIRPVRAQGCRVTDRSHMQPESMIFLALLRTAAYYRGESRPALLTLTQLGDYGPVQPV